MLAVQSGNQVEHGFRGRPVQITRWFIRQQQLRFVDQGARKSDSLLLVARKFARAVMSARLESDLAEPPGRLTVNVMPGMSAHQQRHGYIFQCREFREQVVELPDKPDLTVSEVRGGIVG